MVRAPRAWTAGALAFTGAAACSSPRDVAVKVVNPCDTDVLSMLDYLGFEPRGTNVDSANLTQFESVSDGKATPIKIPIVSDFRLVVSGYKGSPDPPPVALGVSATYDLTAGRGPVDITTMIDPVDVYHATSDLSMKGVCTKPGDPRVGHSATVLPNGKVLIVGGQKVNGNSLDYPLPIEMYDPASGTFSRWTDLPPALARAYHTATLLPDGRVLIAGGERISPMGVRESLQSAFLIDPSQTAGNAIMMEIKMLQPRSGHIASLVDSGKAVLLAGGREYSATAQSPTDHIYRETIELFDPTANKFYPPNAGGATAVMHRKRFAHSAVVLKSGTDVVVAGGFNETGPELNMEILHATNCAGSGGCNLVVSATTAAIGFGPIFHAASLTSSMDGQSVVFSGGWSAIADAEPAGTPTMHSSLVVEVWQYRAAPEGMTRICSGALDAERARHSSIVVGDRVLFSGGYDAGGTAHADGAIGVLEPMNGGCFTDGPTTKRVKEAVAEAATTVLSTGQILIVGGHTAPTGTAPFGTMTSGAYIFSPSRVP
jgi:hypothetical protein